MMSSATCRPPAQWPRGRAPPRWQWPAPHTAPETVSWMAAWSFSLEFARPVPASLVGRDRAPALRSLSERHEEPAEYLAAAVVRGEAVRRELLGCWDPHCITFRAADGCRVAVEARTLHGGPPAPDRPIFSRLWSNPRAATERPRPATLAGCHGVLNS